jgi:IMP dehydrogenase
MKIKETLSYDDVLLVPRYSEIKSRKQINIGNNFNNAEFSLPIISAPMDTVTEAAMAVAMQESGGLGIIHRYNTVQKQCRLVHNAISAGAENVGAAIGVSDDCLNRALALHNAGAKVICVDVAHGHHSLVRRTLENLKNIFDESIHIMAGNVATLEAFNDLADWGADSVRIGIGGGSICSTRIQTGHGVPSFQSIIDCSQSDRDALLIADGGIRTPGDIVKAMAAGADFVIVGSLLAGTTETPGEVLYISGERYKSYRGMASEEAQKDWRGSASSLEGISTRVPYRGEVKNILTRLERGIRSGFSYSGAGNLAELQSKAKFVKQTPAGQFESSTHIEGRYE